MRDSYVKERDRSRIPEQFQWDLSPVYAGDDAWEAAKRKLLAELPSIASWEGTLAESP
jgi:oligoendopeptidase F